MSILFSPSQVRAACGLLDWSASDLAEKIGISKQMMSAYFSTKSNLSALNMEKMAHILDNAGIAFTRGGGVEPYQSRVITYQGYDGFAAFRADILAEGKVAPLDVCVSNVDEREFDKWGQGGINEEYFAEMQKKKPKQFRIIVKENDFHLSASGYASYRWLPESEFGKISFFIYGKKTAILSFEENEFQAFIILHPKISAFYRQEFEILWSRAHDKSEVK